MTKQINYGLHETIEGSHRTLSEAVTMYAIYYSDWTESLDRLAEFYASAKWADEECDYFDPEHVRLVKNRDDALVSVQEIGKELRSLGLDVDLAEWASVDLEFEKLEAA